MADYSLLQAAKGGVIPDLGEEKAVLHELELEETRDEQCLGIIGYETYNAVGVKSGFSGKECRLGILKPQVCKTGSYDGPDDYYLTMSNALYLEGNETDKMFNEYKLTDVDVEMDDTSSGMLQVDHKSVPKFVKQWQEMYIHIGDHDNTYVRAVAQSLPSASNYGLKFKICGLRSTMSASDRSKTYQSPGDKQIDDNGTCNVKVEADDITGLDNFNQFTSTSKSFKAVVEWIPDDTVYNRIARCLELFYDLTKPNSNSASDRLPPDKVHQETGMPLFPRNVEATQLSEPIRDIIIRGKQRQAINYFNHAKRCKDPKFDHILKDFNESQRKAILQSESNFVSLIQGPPGTGKTNTGTGIIRRAWRLGQKVLITAPSNTAVDNILRALLNSAESSTERQQMENDLIRVCSRGQFYSPASDVEPFTIFQYSTNPDVWENSDVYCQANWRETFSKKYGKQKQQLTKQQNRQCAAYMVKYHKALLKQKFNLVFATCNGCADAQSKACFFDLLIIDEAAQDTEPAVLVPMLLLKITGRVTLLGDHQQLGPVIQSHEAQQLGFGLTLFERLYNMKVNFTLLNRQYRMNPYIGDLVSELCYNKQIFNGTTVEMRTLPLSPTYPTNIAKRPVAFVSCRSMETYNRNDRAVTNIYEANCVIDAVVQLICQENVPAKRIAVITSYNAQLKLLKNLIGDIISGASTPTGNCNMAKLCCELQQLRVGTVDSFQGQESDVVLYSIVRSNNQLNVGFLDQYKRLNVAISRAKSLLLLFGNPTMFPRKDVLERLVGCKHANEYGRQFWFNLIKWCFLHNVIFFPNGQIYSLPSEDIWPIVSHPITGTVKNDGIDEIAEGNMFVVSSQKNQLIVSIRNHLVKNLKSRRGEAQLFLRQTYNALIYAPPSVMATEGWSDVIISRLPRNLHEEAFNYVQEIINRHEMGRIDMKRCFALPTYENRGQRCSHKNILLFKGDLSLDMPDYHYRDTEFVMENGLKGDF